ncbi:uncharacterized protein LOC131675146 [Phymastichus coffea]|uniref:uncharacterized protein LOC131675146 n=1 Tax=Phymastichus coffea TaxID=108790 RepID=UPI00273B6C90|nr:uncharacterized protein LOC131675146 [Phymastichus coffea]
MSISTEKLIDYFSISNATNLNGQNVLHYIVTTGCIGLTHYQCNKLIKYFINKGCDINLQDNLGRTPIHVAVEEENVNELDILLTNGADPNILDNEGKTVFEHSWQRLGKGTHTSFKIQSYRYLACYLNKMQVAGCWISERNRHIYRISLNAYNYYCHSNLEVHSKELHKMSKIYLNHQINLKSFLEKKENEISLLINSEILEKVLKNVDHEFPIFGCVLKLQYTKGFANKKLSNNAHIALEKMINFKLPVLCFENIRIYLDQTDLKNMINSIKELQKKYSNCTLKEFSQVCKMVIQSF